MGNLEIEIKIFQGIHMIFEYDQGKLWGDNERKSEIVVIGRNLDEKFFKEGFANCIAD